MNQLFNRTRFIRLWRSYWIERWQDLAGVLLFGGLLGLVFNLFYLGISSNSSRELFLHNGQMAWYVCGLFVFGCIFSSLYFRPLSDKSAGLLVLHRPASSFEKILLALAIIGCVFPLAFTLAFTALNYPFIKLAQFWYVPCKECKNSFEEFRPFLPFVSSHKANMPLLFSEPYIKLQWLAFSYYLSAQAIILGGYVFFRRYPMLFIALCMVLLFLVAMALQIPINNLGYWEYAPNSSQELSRWELFISLFAWILIPIGLWATVYFHLKEKQLP